MILIRNIREDDAIAFREVLDSVCRERKYLAQLKAPPIESVQRFVSSNVQGDYPQFVALDDAAIVGWCDAIPEIRRPAPLTLVGSEWASLEYRCRSIGRRLIDATITKAELLGLEKIELSVHASNTPAIALYRSVGFEEEGRKKRAWFVDGIYDDIVLMALELRKKTTQSLHPTRQAAAADLKR